jgi:spore coat protein U-like protein
MAVALFAASAVPAQAASATRTMGATITIQANCQVSSAGTMDFGTVGVLNANNDAQSTLTVECSEDTAFQVGLDNGAQGSREMANGAQSVSYELYSDPAHTASWGNMVGSDTVSGMGTGGALALTVYGRVPPQATPVPGTYSDTVTVTITY